MRPPITPLLVSTTLRSEKSQTNKPLSSEESTTFISPRVRSKSTARKPGQEKAQAFVVQEASSLESEPGSQATGTLGSPCSLTVDAAGIRPDISWYTVCKGSLIGRLLANLGRHEERKS